MAWSNSLQSSFCCPFRLSIIAFAGWLIFASETAVSQSDGYPDTDTSEVANQDLATVSRLRQTLMEGSLDERRKAAKQTLNLPPADLVSLLPVFIELLRHESDGQIRLAIFDTLREMGPAASPATPALTNSIRQRFGGRQNEELHQNYRAALVLAAIGKEAVEDLRNLLLEDSESIRAEAAMALGRIGTPAAAAIPDLIQLLGDESPRVTRDAVAALGGIGSPATESLIEVCGQSEEKSRSGALAALAKSSPNDPRVQELVIRSLTDESAGIRKVACESLERLQIEESRLGNFLITCLQDDADEVGAAAVRVFVENTALISEFKPHLTQLLSDDRDAVSWHAAFLIQKLGADSLPNLLAAAESMNGRLEQLSKAISLIDKLDVNELYKSLDHSTGRATQVAALALGEIRPVTKTTIEKLADGLRNKDDELRLACLTSLAKLGAQAAEAVPATRQLSENERPEIRKLVVEILSNAATVDDQLLGDLERFADDPSADVQLSAIASLQILGPASRPAIPTVIRGLDSSNLAVRKAVLGFLGSHGSAASDSVVRLCDELSGQADDEWRATVIETLGQIGRGAKPAFGELAQCLSEPSPEIRAAALDAVSKLDLPVEQVAPRYLEALRDDDESVRSRASSVIRRLGDDGVMLLPDLIPLLTKANIAEDVERLLSRLERYPTRTSSIAPLLQLTQHENELVQQNAIRFLGLLREQDDSVLQALQAFTENDNEALRLEAAAAIQKLKDNATS